MSLQLVLPNFLIADSGTAARVDNRVFWDELPQGLSYPAIIMFVISAPTSYHHQGASALRMMRVQCDCRAASADDARQLADALEARLGGYKGVYDGVLIDGAFKDGHRSSSAKDGSVHWFSASTDYLIWSKPA